MRALVQQSLRGPVDLTLTTTQPRPVPGRGEYLVRVGAAGLNFADVMQANGTYGQGPTPPYVAGFEAAGVIVGSGDGVEEPLPPGTQVIGSGAGAFADYMVMRAADVLPSPSGWTAAQSLGLVLNWATALAALRPLRQVEPGDVVLVHAAAGGVGQAAIRLAKHYGAIVVATASPSKHELLAGLGVDAVLDRTGPDLAERITALTGGVDVVLESVGRATMGVSLAVAKPIVGRVVVFGAASGDATFTTQDLVFTHPVQLKGLHIGRLAAAAPSLFASIVDELCSLIGQGVYSPGSPQVHALGEGPGVIRRLQAGETHGKHALRLGPDS